MPSIELEIKDLNARGEQVRDLLRPLTLKDKGPAWQPKSANRVYIIGTHDGSPPSSNYRDWRFATYVPGYRGMYFELWREDENNRWYLDRAYLSLYKFESYEQNEAEFISLHCDPNEAIEAAHSIYKRGPHLHINGGTPHPIPHSHIALQQDKQLELVLESCGELTIAISWGIRMIKEEILDTIYEELVAAA
jgi:hypothetical protein